LEYNAHGQTNVSIVPVQRLRAIRFVFGRTSMNNNIAQTPPSAPVHSRLRGLTEESLAEYYSGRKLWGDDFGIEEIREWYQLEENACFDIYDQGRRRMPNNDYLHWQNGYRWALNGRNTLGKVLGLGSGNGEEFRPVRQCIGHLYIVESAGGYFKNDAATTYVKAQVDGSLDFADEFFDTAVNIAVLHHIPNLSHVLRELFRVLKPGGICLIKEPITTLGDWHPPRKPGLAPCERGFPRDLLEKMIRQAGFELVRKSYFEFPPLRHVRDRGGIDTYNSKFWTGLDWFCCRLTDWNYRYHRQGWFQKLAPSYAFLVLKKPVVLSS
jgi:SAM-dependent methyltransferase